jgi:hypothetical protein
MMSPHRLVLLAAFLLGCGTTQSTVSPESRTDGFPSQPYSFQKRPGKDGKCDSRGPPEVIVRGGGCWEWVTPTPAECEESWKQGAATVLYEGRCYYPIVNIIPKREPTSRTAQPSREAPSWG